MCFVCAHVHNVSASLNVLCVCVCFGSHCSYCACVGGHARAPQRACADCVAVFGCEQRALACRLQKSENVKILS